MNFASFLFFLICFFYYTAYRHRERKPRRTCSSGVTNGLHWRARRDLGVSTPRRAGSAAESGPAYSTQAPHLSHRSQGLSRTVLRPNRRIQGPSHSFPMEKDGTGTRRAPEKADQGGKNLCWHFSMLHFLRFPLTPPSFPFFAASSARHYKTSCPHSTDRYAREHQERTPCRMFYWYAA